MTLARTTRHKDGQCDRVGARMIVVGGSMAGLLAARVLSDAFDEVVVLERDSLPDEPTGRDGVPQSRQPHILMRPIQTALDDLFPGFGEELLANGGLLVDWSTNVRVYSHGGYVSYGEYDTSYCASRPLVEHVVRSRIRDSATIDVRDGHRFVDYQFDYAEKGVTGVAFADGDVQYLVCLRIQANGENADQYSQDFGQAADQQSSDLDYVLVEKTNSSLDFDITIEWGGTRYKVAGRMTNNEYWMNEDEEIYKTGKNTGHLQGQITGVDDHGSGSCADLNGDGVEWNMDQAEGYSGCAPFRIYTSDSGDEYAYVSGLATLGRSDDGGVNCDGTTYSNFDYSVGASADAIHNEGGVYFS